jgi:hypothetical protein
MLQPSGPQRACSVPGRQNAIWLVPMTAADCSLVSLCAERAASTLMGWRAHPLITLFLRRLTWARAAVRFSA